MWIYHCGQFGKASEFSISPLDRGFLYGDTIYETLLLKDNSIRDLSAHFFRLKRSAQGVYMDLPMDQHELEEAMSQALKSGLPKDRYMVRVTISRGSGAPGLASLKELKADWWVFFRPVQSLDIQRERVLVAVNRCRWDARSLDPIVKSGNGLNAILAHEEALRAGGSEALLLNTNGNIAEGDTFNIFWKTQQGWKTPALSTGILDGITRKNMLEIMGNHGVKVSQVVEPLNPEEWISAFATSSVRGIMPFSKLKIEQISKEYPLQIDPGYKLWSAEYENHGEWVKL